MRWAAPALALAALVLAGCETTAEESAKLEKQAKAHERVARVQSTPLSARVAHASTRAHVTGALVMRGSEATAVAVTLANTSSSTLRDIPIEVTAHGSGGSVVYTNDVAGLSPSLTSVALLPAHSSLTWIDDQVQATAAPSSVSARLGEGERVTQGIPRLSAEGRVTEVSSSGVLLEGHVVNHSSVEQRELVVYCVARRGGRVVAVGRAVLTQAPAHSATRFEIFFEGNPKGAQLELTAPPTTLG